jgi:hypothetical protein
MPEFAIGEPCTTDRKARRAGGVARRHGLTIIILVLRDPGMAERFECRLRLRWVDDIGRKRAPAGSCLRRRAFRLALGEIGGN